MFQQPCGIHGNFIKEMKFIVEKIKMIEFHNFAKYVNNFSSAIREAT